MVTAEASQRFYKWMLQQNLHRMKGRSKCGGKDPTLWGVGVKKYYISRILVRTLLFDSLVSIHMKTRDPSLCTVQALFVATKAHAVLEAVKSVAHRLSSNTTLILPQNGVDWVRGSGWEAWNVWMGQSGKVCVVWAAGMGKV